MEENKKILQNDVWMVEIGYRGIVGHEQKGKRPFYVISNDRYNQNSKTPIGYFISTSEKKKTNRYVLEIDVDGTTEYVNVSQIRTLSEERFLYKMGNCNNKILLKLQEIFLKNIIEE